MKRPLIYLLLLVLMPLTAFANLPKGTTVYLNTTDFGGGHTCYYIYLSSKSKWFLMNEVPNRAGYYSYVATDDLQENVRFGYYKGDPGTCQASMSWTDNISQIKNSDDPKIPSATMTCYHPTSASAGTWEDGSWSADEVVNVTYQVIESSCVDSTATIEVTVTLTGSTATLKLSGPMFANERLLPKCATPYIFKYYTSGKLDAPAQMTLTASACSNTAGTSINNTITTIIARPVINCTDSFTTDSICNTVPTTTLSTTMDADSIQWYDNNKKPCYTNQKTITVPVADGATYTVDYFSTQISSHNNLMANGSFEDGYSGFYSDYQPISQNKQPVLDPLDVYSGKYDNGSDYGKYYAIMSNANRFWPGDGVNNGYADITAHDGQYFLVADATDVGYAWKATTADNPNLKLVKGQQYIFSYWAAYPNLPDQFDDPAAVLQFAIEYDDEQSQHHIEALGAPYQLGNQTPLYDWYQQTTTWTAPYNSSNVSIGVKDLTQSAEGNDFCLDDIIFQPVTGSKQVFAHRDVFTIVTKYCGDMPVVYRDTACQGDTYAHGAFHSDCAHAGMQKLVEGKDTLYLFVIETINIQIDNLKKSLCDVAQDVTVEAKPQVKTGQPASYEITYEPKLLPTIKETAWSSAPIKITVPASAVGQTIQATMTAYDADHRCPQSFHFTIAVTVGAGLPIYAKWDNVLFVDNHEDQFVSYQWYRNELPINGATEQALYTGADKMMDDGNEYYVIATHADGTTEQSCSILFADVERSAPLYPGHHISAVSQRLLYQVGPKMYIVETTYSDGSTEIQKVIER